MNDPVDLDDLYYMVSHIYYEQNYQRSESKTFSHFVEVCGMLTAPARGKKREVEFESAICKAFGWFFPLMAKCGLKSVKEIVYRKYPNACPYCRKIPHDEAKCKTVRGTEKTVNHDALRKLYVANKQSMPVGLNEWQNMFQAIYPRSTEDKYRSTIGLFEELGELAEAIRIYDRHPKFFAGEAADVFSYLMGLANEYSLRLQVETGISFNLENEFLKRFPGICVACGNLICSCPSVPAATIGRMTKEMELIPGEDLFGLSHTDLHDKGEKAAYKILERSGGLGGIYKSLPLDRGQINQSLVLLCLTASSEIEKENPDAASNLRSIAEQIGLSLTEAGGKTHNTGIISLIETIKESLRNSATSDKLNAMSHQKPLMNVLNSAITKIRILVASSDVLVEDRLDSSGEAKKIDEAIRRSNCKDKIEVDSIFGITLEDLNRKLLDSDFSILHFSGHGDSGIITVRNDMGESQAITMESLRGILKNHPSVKCVILNSCKSLAGIVEPIADVTIGMESTIDDDAALKFSSNFYDAIGAGKNINDAYQLSIDMIKAILPSSGFKSVILSKSAKHK